MGFVYQRGVFQVLWIYYGLLIGSRPVIAWNLVAVLINSLTLAAYRPYDGRDTRKQIATFNLRGSGQFGYKKFKSSPPGCHPAYTNTYKEE